MMRRAFGRGGGEGRERSASPSGDPYTEQLPPAVNLLLPLVPPLVPSSTCDPHQRTSLSRRGNARRVLLAPAPINLHQQHLARQHQPSNQSAVRTETAMAKAKATAKILLPVFPPASWFPVDTARLLRWLPSTPSGPSSVPPSRTTAFSTPSPQLRSSPARLPTAQRTSGGSRGSELSCLAEGVPRGSSPLPPTSSKSPVFTCSTFAERSNARGKGRERARRVRSGERRGRAMQEAVKRRCRLLPEAFFPPFSAFSFPASPPKRVPTRCARQ